MDSLKKNSGELIMIGLLIIAFSLSVSAQQLQVPNQRMAGYHYSVLFTAEMMPSSAMMTYPVKNFDAFNCNFLVKYMPCFIVDGKII